MRRLMLSGLGLTLGFGTSAALAQSPPSRSASLGRPIAIVAGAPAAPQPAAEGPVEGYDPNEVGVTPAGLFSRSRPVTSTSQQVPFNSTMIPSVRPQGAVTGMPVPGGTFVPGQAYPTGVPGQAYPTGVPVGTPGFGSVIGSPPTGMPGWTTMQPVPMQMPSTTPLPGAKGPTGPSVTEMREGQPLPKPSPLVPGAAIMGAPSAVWPGAAAPAMDDPFFGGGCAGGHCGFERLQQLFGGGIFNPRPGPARYWASAEYLAWWTQNPNVPVLATTTIVPGQDGFIGQSGTIPVLGGTDTGSNPISGFRLGLGWWFNDCQTRGLDARFFILGANSDNGGVSSSTFPQLTRPFFNLNEGIQFGETVSFPGFADGAVVSDIQTSVWGAEVNYRQRLGRCDIFPCARLDGLIGFRYLSLKDQFNVNEAFIRTGTSVPTVGLPDVVAGLVQDQFRTENNFYGGQIGLTGEVRRGRWFIDTRATVAFGATTQAAEIYGAQNLVLANGGLIQSQGGLLTAPGANIGKHTQSKFAVMPEVGVNVGYHLTPHLRAFVGYNFLYLSSVLRAPDLVDTSLDVTRIPNFPLREGVTQLAGTPRPMPIMKATDWVAQGITFGLAYTW